MAANPNESPRHFYNLDDGCYATRRLEAYAPRVLHTSYLRGGYGAPPLQWPRMLSRISSLGCLSGYYDEMVHDQ